MMPPLPPEEELVREAEPPEAKYTDIIIYTSGSLAVAMAVIIVVLCRMQTQSSKQPLEPMAVHKLSKFPLIRQVRAELEPWGDLGGRLALLLPPAPVTSYSPDGLSMSPALGDIVPSTRPGG